MQSRPSAGLPALLPPCRAGAGGCWRREPRGAGGAG
jgi:hypothetical protein